MSTTVLPPAFPDPEVRKYEDWRTTKDGKLKFRRKPEEAPEEEIIDVVADPIDRMITERQAAVILGVSKDTLKKWRTRRRGPRYYKYHDGAIRYSLADLNQYFADHMVEN